MTCRELIDFLADYLDGELPDPQRVAFEGHLKECEDCVTYLATYQATIRLARAAWPDGGKDSFAEVPPDLIKGIQSALSGPDQF